MITLLEHPEMDQDLINRMNERADFLGFKCLNLFEINEKFHSGKSINERYNILKSYIDHMMGFITYHSKIDTTTSILINPGLFWVTWLAEKFNIHGIDEYLLNATKSNNFSRIVTLYVVPSIDSQSITIDQNFDKSFKFQHDIMLKNYLNISDSRRYNKYYHIVCSTNDDDLVADVERMLIKTWKLKA